jgi:hypothetical protein
MASRVAFLKRGRGTDCRSLAALAMGGTCLLFAPSVLASPLVPPEAVQSRGVPVAQTFLADHGENVSMVATRDGVNCVASRPLPIRESEYRGGDGVEVPFKKVTRSPASSIQAIARPGEEISFRVQLKYSPDTAEPIWLSLADEEFDLSDTLEPSRDSLWLTGEYAEVLGLALAAGDTSRLQAISAETGRQVIDRIDAPSLAGLHACLETLASLEKSGSQDDVGAETAEIDGDAVPIDKPRDNGRSAEVALVDDAVDFPALPIPAAGVRLELVAHPDPDARVTEEQLEGCRMRDIPDELYRGHLTKLTGFFSQTDDVYVAFDDAGQLQRAYIPGIFDSDLTNGSKNARVSLAADSNVPDRPNTVRGCLGEARIQAPFCVYPGAVEGTYSLAECGVLGVWDEVENGYVDTLSWGTPGSRAASRLGAQTSAPPRVVSAPGRWALSPPSFGSTPGGPISSPTLPPDRFPPYDDRPRDPNDPNPPPGERPDGPRPETPHIPPIPLPAAFWLLLSAVVGLSGIRVLRRPA